MLDRRCDQILLEGSEGDGAAGLKSQDLGDFSAVVFHDLGGFERQLDPFGGSCCGPSRKRCHSSLHCAHRVLASTRSDLGVDRPAVWLEVVKHLLVGGRFPLAPDEYL